MAVKKSQQSATPRMAREQVMRECLELTEDDLYGEPYGLTAQQWQCVALLVAGTRQVDAARALDVTEETVSRWKTLPTFTAALNAAIRDAYEATLGQVRTAASDAVGVLTELLHAEDEKVRLQAALHVLRLHLSLSGSVGVLPVTPADVAREQLQGESLNRSTERLLFLC